MVRLTNTYNIMKKLFFLPLVAMLCFGCSKSGSEGDLSLQKAGASQTDVIAISNMIDRTTLYSDSYVDYTDANGRIQTVCLNDGLSPDIEILSGSSITFRLVLWQLNEGKLYCAIRNETFVDDDCEYRDRTSGGVYENLTTFSQIRKEVVIKKPWGQISIWASMEDFSEGALDSGEYCICPND